MLMKSIKTKKIIKITAVLILCAVLTASFVSCGTGGGKAAMTLTYGDNTTTFSSNIYSYYLSYEKTLMLYQLYYSQGVTDTSTMTDLPDFWTSVIDGTKTYGQMAKEQAENDIKKILATVAYAKDHGLELTKEKKNEVDTVVKNLIKDSFSQSTSSFNSTLARFGIDESIYKEIKRYEATGNLVTAYLFDSSTGKIKITNDMINQYYQSNCARVKHILILYTPGTYDVDGNPESYSEEELAERKAKVEDIYNRILNGEDFDSLLSESEDPGTASYPDGYTISKDTSFVPEFVTAAFDMEIGEVRKVESSYGMHIMKRYDLLPANEALNTDTSAAWATGIGSDMQSVALNEELKPYIEKIEIDTSETNLFNIATCDIMFDCSAILQ